MTHPQPLARYQAALAEGFVSGDVTGYKKTLMDQ
jgi:hypothetical protein